ncbi:MAG: hypothetical protein H0X26_08025 [Alphaproteobacteria bacterium]|nr:hypothetical protein [Alphaproteobacteria bacterium]
MIYAGILSFGPQSLREEDLKRAVGDFAETSPSVLHKDSLVLCYGKLSAIQDLDDLWENDSSILLGRVFEKERSDALDKETFKEQSLLSTEAVLNQVWGKYVYLNVNNKQLEVIVDSTGQLPFFYYPFSDGSILFASDIEIIFKVLNQKPEYNWEYLCSYLIYSNRSAIQTPFKNIFELPAACSLKITKNERKTIPFWNPLHSYKNQDLQEKNAVSILQNTLKPWIEPYKNICVSLSGGLDSSALVYCLKELVTKDQKLTALNYFHSQVKSSNELAHARQVCKEMGIELIEVDASNSLPFDSSYKKRPLKPNKPLPGFISLKWLETIAEHLPTHEASTFISGHGSDHIFMRPPSKKSTADYLLEKGIKGYKKQLENIANFYRDPLYSVLRENAANLWSYSFSHTNQKRNFQKPMDEIPCWVKQEARQKTSQGIIHPIYAHLPKKILPGKYDQINAVYEGLASIHVPIDNQIDPTYYPFLYEPVVEFALSFPTYELFDKGYDRYPLRKSVSDTFKTNTVWRRDKSQTTGLFQLGIKRNLESVLSLCLEGHFVKLGMVDEEGLRRTINLIGSGDAKHLCPFIHLASLELFLRFWD